MCVVCFCVSVCFVTWIGDAIAGLYLMELIDFFCCKILSHFNPLYKKIAILEDNIKKEESKNEDDPKNGKDLKMKTTKK